MRTEITGTINGSQFAYDVPTKARATKYALKECAKVPKKGSQPVVTRAVNEVVAKIAAEYGVTPTTIKAWMKKYYLTYNDYVDLPQGTMRMANVLVTGKEEISLVRDMLKRHKEERIALSKQIDPEYEAKRGAKLTFSEMEELQAEKANHTN